MKVRDTLEVDKIYSTLPDKIENFVGVRTSDSDTQHYIRKNFPKHQYNYGDFETVLIWCEKNLGNNFIWEWTMLYFKTEKDKTFFLLRWACE